jgi:hypothetical protein
MSTSDFPRPQGINQVCNHCARLVLFPVCKYLDSEHKGLCHSISLILSNVSSRFINSSERKFVEVISQNVLPYLPGILGFLVPRLLSSQHLP